MVFTLLWGLAYFLLPKPDLYEKYSFSSAVYDRSGKLLKISLSMDDKYRLFVPREEIPDTAVQALLSYEDKGFYYHPGINPLSIFRALCTMAAGGRKQGASTITMQLARIIYDIDSSKISGKFLQMLRALQIEIFYDKEEILEAYFNLAPYGGNIEGIGAAARIYFNERVSELKLPQIALLTVIPQNPGKRTLLTRNGKKSAEEASRRLQRIWLENHDHSENNYLTLPVASGVYLPSEAPHFARLVQEKTSGEINTVLDLNYQKMAENILRTYIEEHHGEGVANGAALIVDARSMDILAYVGSRDFFDNTVQGQVDGTKALRSPGSALKPFIYALALEKGIIHPLTMLKDVPRNYGIYTPENFDRSFFGLVSATEALVYSRNIPAVDLLLKVGEDKFHRLLQEIGVRDLRSAEFYGLAAALGGVEVSMQNLAAMYAMLYNHGQFRPLRLLKNDVSSAKQLLKPEAAFLVLDMLSKNKAPDEIYEAAFQEKSPYPVAWKTGTSYGYKDAWTAGIVGPYVIVVWIGNFDGMPNHAFIGRSMAAPLFFRLVRRIAKINVIPQELRPGTDLNLAKVKICRDTGDIADPYCRHPVLSYFIPGVSTIKLSNVSRLIPIDKKTGLRACRHTPPQTEMKSFDFWPSDVIRAYTEAGISLRRPPDFKENCTEIETFKQGHPPQITLPADNSRFLIRSYKLEEERIILKADMDADASVVYWFVNDRLMGETPAGSILEIKPEIGSMAIKAVDDIGRSSTIKISVILGD